MTYVHRIEKKSKEENNNVNHRGRKSSIHSGNPISDPLQYRDDNRGAVKIEINSNLLENNSVHVNEA